MRIRNEFSRFMHGVVLKELWALRYLEIRELHVAIRPFYLAFDTLKQVLKRLDTDYPKDKEGKPLSYTKLNNEEVLSHIAFIERLMSENHHEANYLKEVK